MKKTKKQTLIKSLAWTLLLIIMSISVLSFSTSTVFATEEIAEDIITEEDFAEEETPADDNFWKALWNNPGETLALTMSNFSGSIANNIEEIAEDKVTNIMNSFIGYLVTLSDVIITITFEFIANAFKPNFDLLGQILDQKLLLKLNTIGDAQIYDEDSFFAIPLVGDITKATKIIGLILSSLLCMYGLFNCLFGQAHKIKTTPWGIVLRYGLGLLMIYASDTIIFAFSGVMGNVWSLVTGTTLNVQTLNAGNFSDTIVTKMILGGALGTSLLVPGVGSLLTTMITIVAVCLAFALIKQMVSLFLEIVQRYFIIMFLLLGFPIVAPTITVSETESVMKSYFQMLITGCINLVLDVLFMGIFLHILAADGWTSGILNYICALAYLKTVQKLDDYLRQMRLSIASCASDFSRTVNGAFRTIGEGVRTIAAGDRMAKNTGRRMMEHAVATNNFDLYRTGNRLSKGLGYTAEGCVSSFNSSIAKQDGLGIKTYTAGGGKSAIENAVASKDLSSAALSYISPGFTSKTSGVVALEHGDCLFKAKDGTVIGSWKGKEGIFTEAADTSEIGKLSTYSDRGPFMRTDEFGHSEMSYSPIGDEETITMLDSMVPGAKLDMDLKAKYMSPAPAGTWQGRAFMPNPEGTDGTRYYRDVRIVDTGKSTTSIPKGWQFKMYEGSSYAMAISEPKKYESEPLKKEDSD